MSTNESSCYSTLATYNSKVPGTVRASAMVVGRPDNRVMRAPVWGGIGYDTFSHGKDERCGGYFTIEGAYPSYSKNCGASMVRNCAGTELRK
tara:strand:+ start:1613 stop:1888 length:276 start_codon:yes stop_codon:yes gene_type:complete